MAAYCVNSLPTFRYRQIVPKRRQEITAMCCVISKKSADLLLHRCESLKSRMKISRFHEIVVLMRQISLPHNLEQNKLYCKSRDNLETVMAFQQVLCLEFGKGFENCNNLPVVILTL